MRFVEITTPSRLHFGLLDMNGSIGRVDGGIGVSLEKPSFHARISASESWEYPKYMKEIVEKARVGLKLKKKYKIEVYERIPPHVGLGSMTQMSLGVAYSTLKFENMKIDVKKLAEIMGRGGTSGIGTYAFIGGGFILDGGHSRKVKNDFLPSHFSKVPPPPLLFRASFPRRWVFLLVIPPLKKTYGKKEKRIFKNVCPISKREVEETCRIVLMKILPGIVEKNINDVGEGLTMIQKIGFKRIENKLLGKKNDELQKILLKCDAYGVGLSSFGPTVYSLFENTKEAKNAEGVIKERFGYMCIITKANNRGANIIYH